MSIRSPGILENIQSAMSNPIFQQVANSKSLFRILYLYPLSLLIPLQVLFRGLTVDHLVSTCILVNAYTTYPCLVLVIQVLQPSQCLLLLWNMDIACLMTARSASQACILKYASE